ncbi:putative aspartic peptidase domain superfamily [Helianthus annuus]|nr:putative aspartic peptidase domain superfamily [Helianthus annuus]KAJ0529890.1 putative aspartic peptidase domain superfamily [Helianthus annuus]KAJ0696762.1 putative aspartic peptidase domain superfamily [Helianthus annuus]KAJ0879478.1 putative aspartic peptidase domain superfamily [Helianthus annuus]
MKNSAAKLDHTRYHRNWLTAARSRGIGGCDTVQGQGGGGRNYNNMNSNTYHPGLRNHPNFRYGNPSNQVNPNFQGKQGFQRQYQTGQSSSGGNKVMEMLKAMQVEMQRMNQRDEVWMQKDEARDKAIQTLTTQMGQLASEVAILKKAKGQLPSDTVINPKNIKSVNIYVVSTVPSTKFNEKCLTSSSQINTGIGKDTDGENDNERGAPIVPIRVGKLKIPYALLDYGASMSVLPGDLYDMYDFGPLEDIDTMVSLADESWRRPRGVVRNVMIRLGEFNYPVDFLVLDYASTKLASQQRVILGRPFLYIANAQINFRDGVITMTEKNRKLYFDVHTREISYESIEEKGRESSDHMKSVHQRIKTNKPPGFKKKYKGSSKYVVDYPPNGHLMDALQPMTSYSGGGDSNRFFEPP